MSPFLNGGSMIALGYEIYDTDKISNVSKEFEEVLKEDRLKSHDGILWISEVGNE